MKLRNHQIILIAFFLAYFTVRLFFSLQSEYFNSESSYFALREIEHISKTWKPLIHDSLSYSGGDFVFMPFYYYFLAVFSRFLPEIIIIKIINSLLASAIVPAIFLCVHKITKNSAVSVVSSVVASLSPFYIAITLNDISLYSAVTPGCFFLLYLFMRLDEDIETLNSLIPVTLAVVLASSSVFVLIIAVGIFFIISYVEKVQIKKILFEYYAFLLLFFFWTNFIIYKAAFLKHGFSIISGNLPKEVIRQYFSIDIFQTFLSVGIITSVLGIYTVYLYIAGKKWKDIILFISLFFSVLGLFLVRLIEADLAMSLLSMSLIILSGKAIVDIFDLIDKSKIAAYSKKIFVISLIVVVIAQGLPGILEMPKAMAKGVDKNYIRDLIWIRDNIPEKSIIAATPEEGNLITYFSEKKNIADTNYLLAEDPGERLGDIDRIFKTVVKVDAITLLEKYDAGYILFSDFAKQKYGDEEPLYAKDKCFALLLDSAVKLYKKDESCRVKSYEK